MLAYFILGVAIGLFIGFIFMMLLDAQHYKQMHKVARRAGITSWNDIK